MTRMIHVPAHTHRHEHTRSHFWYELWTSWILSHCWALSLEKERLLKDWEEKASTQKLQMQFPEQQVHSERLQEANSTSRIHTMTSTIYHKLRTAQTGHLQPLRKDRKATGQNYSNNNHNQGRKLSLQLLATNYKPEKHHPQAEKTIQATLYTMRVTKCETR